MIKFIMITLNCTVWLNLLPLTLQLLPDFILQIKDFKLIVLE
jgi:hypothetical protein